MYKMRIDFEVQQCIGRFWFEPMVFMYFEGMYICGPKNYRV